MNQDTIKAAIASGQYAKVNFVTYKAPKVGKLVVLQSHQRMLNNGFVRFVSLGKLEDFNNAPVHKKELYTLLLSLKDIKLISLTTNV